MLPLNTTFTERGFRYEQICREDNVAIFIQTHSDGAVRYDVVIIRVQPAHAWPHGTVSPEREAYPGASSWGRLAFACFTLEQARALFTLLHTGKED
jgi:hypothetical protein